MHILIGIIGSYVAIQQHGSSEGSDNYVFGIACLHLLHQGTTGEGIHCAVMAGTLDILLSNFVGLRQQADGSIVLRPTLPKHWNCVRFRQRIKGKWFEFEVSKKDVKLCLIDGNINSDEPTGPFYVGNNKLLLCPWSSVTVEYTNCARYGSHSKAIKLF